MSKIQDLFSQEFEEKLAITAEGITKSIYYEGKDGNGTSLPNGNLVEPGGLYMMDDDGGLIFQILLPTDNSKSKGKAENPTVTYDSQNNDLTINQATNTAGKVIANSSAYSFKKVSPKKSPPILSPLSYLSFEPNFMFRVTSLIKLRLLSLPPKIKRKVFVAKDANGTDYYLYSVYDAHNQMPVFHMIQPHYTPSPHVDAVVTEIGGAIYVEFNGDVYMGNLRTNLVSILNIDKAFGP